MGRGEGGQGKGSSGRRTDAEVREAEEEVNHQQCHRPLKVDSGFGRVGQSPSGPEPGLSPPTPAAFLHCSSPLYSPQREHLLTQSLFLR